MAAFGRQLKKVAAAEGGGNLFELAAEGRDSLSVALVFLALAPACFSAFAHSYLSGFGPSMFFWLVAPAISNITRYKFIS